MQRNVVYSCSNKNLYESKISILNFSKLIKLWELTEDDAFALLDLTAEQREYAQLNEGMLLSKEQIETISYLIALHLFLEQLLICSEDVIAWLKGPTDADSPTKGLPPLSFMKEHYSTLIASQQLQQWVNLSY